MASCQKGTHILLSQETHRFPGTWFLGIRYKISSPLLLVYIRNCGQIRMVTVRPITTVTLQVAMRTLSTTIAATIFVLLLQHVTAQDTLPDGDVTPRVPVTQSPAVRGLDLSKRQDTEITARVPATLNQSPVVRGLDLSKRQTYSCPAGTYACTGKHFF